MGSGGWERSFVGQNKFESDYILWLLESVILITDLRRKTIFLACLYVLSVTNFAKDNNFPIRKRMSERAAHRLVFTYVFV